MLKIYHAGNSVCSQKVRIVLAEKSTLWESIELDLTKREQFTTEYLRLNPEGVVPTLVTSDGVVIRESSVIIDYIDQLNPDNPLMPTDIDMHFLTRLWLTRTIEIHAAINSITFASMIRDDIKSKMNEQQIEQWVASNLNPQIAEKRRDLMKYGAKSVYVGGALFTLETMLKDMDLALSQSAWLTGDDYRLADATLIAYIDRMDKLAIFDLWPSEYVNILQWLNASRKRPSYETAIVKYDNKKALSNMKTSGQKAWKNL